MSDYPRIRILKHFEHIDDPRRLASVEHRLSDILFIALAATIAGANGWLGMYEWANARKKWLKTILKLPNGIPSHDTISRLFSKIDPLEFEKGFSSWIRTIARVSKGEIIPIDGKAVRGARNRKTNDPLHLVSAWSTQNRVILGQVRTDKKSNEITAIPKLLDLLSLGGNLVTLDAMGCQKKIVKKIVDKKADYVISLKGNQGNIHKDVRACFEECESINFTGVPHGFYETREKGHGREEHRQYYLIDAVQWIEAHEKWKGLRSVGMVISERTVNGKTSVERRYFLSSLPDDAIERFAEAVRKHWSIENELHWCLDVGFEEDACQVRDDNGAQILAVLRRIGLRMLNNEKDSKVGIKMKRKKAGWNNDYLVKVIGVELAE